MSAAIVTECPARLTKVEGPRSLGAETARAAVVTQGAAASREEYRDARRQDGGPGASDLHPSADFSRGHPDAQARRADPRARAPARARFQEAQHELPGDRHG